MEEVKQYNDQETFRAKMSVCKGPTKGAIRTRAKRFKIINHTLYYMQPSKVNDDPILHQIVTSIAKNDDHSPVSCCQWYGWTFWCEKDLSALQE